MTCCSKFLPAFGAWALAATFASAASAEKLDLDRITPVPATEPIPVIDFFRAPFLRHPVLNLNGSHIAALVSAGEDKTNYMTYELKTHQIEAWGAPGDSDIAWLLWLDSQRLVFGISAQKAGAHVMCTADVGNLNTPHPLFQLVGSTLFAVPPGDRRHPLVNLSAGGSLTGKYGEVVVADASLDIGSVIDYHSDYGAIMDQIQRDNERHVLSRFPIMETPGGFDLYYLATKEGKLEFGVSSTDGVLKLHRFDGTGWRDCPENLDEMDLFGAGDTAGDVVVLGPRAGANGKPRPLEFMDAATGQPGEVLFQDANYDFNGSLYRDPVSHDIVGATFDRSGPQVVWFTESYRLLQKAVDALFPGLVVRILGTDESGKIVLLSTFSDRQPAIYRWVNLADRTAGDIQNSLPWIDPKRMQPMNVMKFKTRDGRHLDAYVTLPAGASRKNPPPLVVLPHDTINGRDTWGYNALVQFLASRGYAVLQPNYRGSAGYGWMFPTEDEWDFRKMHEDVTDATKALVGSGLVDRNRVAIMGTDFGGFLALEGAAFEPGLYQCVVAVSPVCDWGRTIEERKYNKFTSPWYTRMMRKLGDPKAAPEKFDALSPLRHAGSIRAAVLIAYGEYDPDDLIARAKDLAADVRRNNVPAETMSFPTESVGVRHLGHQVELYSRVESFLARYLSPSVPNAAAAAPP